MPVSKNRNHKAGKISRNRKLPPGVNPANFSVSSIEPEVEAITKFANETLHLNRSDFVLKAVAEFIDNYKTKTEIEKFISEKNIDADCEALSHAMMYSAIYSGQFVIDKEKLASLLYGWFDGKVFKSSVKDFGNSEFIAAIEKFIEINRYEDFEKKWIIAFKSIFCRDSMVTLIKTFFDKTTNLSVNLNEIVSSGPESDKFASELKSEKEAFFKYFKISRSSEVIENPELCVAIAVFHYKGYFSKPCPWREDRYSLNT